MTSVSAVPIRQTAIAAVVLLILTVLLTWPAALRLSDGITDNLDGELFGVFLLWNALCNMHYAIFSVLLVVIVLAEDVTRRGWRQRLPVYGRVAITSLVAATLFLPIALMYWKAAALYGFKRTLVEAGYYSGRLSDFLDAGPSRLYGWLSRTWPDRREAFFPGLTAIFLGALGAARRGAGPFAGHARKLGFLLAGVGILIALGTSTPFYPALFRISGPLFQAIRVPARGIVLFHLGLAMLAALGLSLLRSRFRSQARYVIVAVGVLVLAVIEYSAFPLVVFWATPRPAPVHQWIAHAPFEGSLIELPFGLDYDIEYVFRSPAHFRAMVNGYSGFFPKEYDSLNALFEKQPIPTQVWQDVLRLGAKIAVYHPDLLTDAREVAYARLLRAGVTSGFLVPIRTFDHSGGKDFVFTIGIQPPGFASPDQLDSARNDFERYLSTAEAQLARPFGWIDFPTEGQSVSPGQTGMGSSASAGTLSRFHQTWIS